MCMGGAVHPRMQESLQGRSEHRTRIEVTNLPANRISHLDRQGVKWRKFNEINVVSINYKKTGYENWEPMKSGLNSVIKLYKIEQ